MRKASFIPILLILILLLSSFSVIVAEQKPERKTIIVVLKAGKTDHEWLGNHGDILDYIPHEEYPAVRISLPTEAIRGVTNNPNVAYIEEDVTISLLQRESRPPRKKPKPTPTPTPIPSPTPTPTPSPSPTPSPTPTPTPTPTSTPTPTPSPTPTPNPEPGVQPTWNLEIHNVIETWEEYGWGAYVHIGIIDTGVNYYLPDLSTNYLGGYDTVNWDPDPFDDNGHGTGVASIILGRGDESYIGVSGNLGYHMYKAFNSEGQASLWSLVYAINYAVNDGALAISMSWGTPDDISLLHDYLRWAFESGVSLFGACGNDGGYYCLYPARYDFVFSVGAMDDDYSSPGWANWNADQIAAGVDVPMLWRDGTVQVHSGSSFSVPHATGLTAFVYSRYMGKFGRLPTPNEVYTAIRNGGYQHPQEVYMDVVCHYGILDAYGTTREI